MSKEYVSSVLYLWIEVSNDIVSKLPNDAGSTCTRAFPAGITVRSFTDLKRTESAKQRQFIQRTQTPICSL